MSSSILLSLAALVCGCSNGDAPLAPGNGGSSVNPVFKWTKVCSDRSLRSAWSYCGSRSYAVGDEGMACFFDGEEWTAMDTGTKAGLKDIWGDSSGILFAVGESGTILEYDGAWTAHSTECAADLNSVWGFSPADVYAAGASGTILHFDGAAWTAMENTNLADINDLWGRSGSDLYAAGAYTTFLHYNGVKWTRMPKPPVVGYTPTYYAVWSDPAGKVYLAGGLIDGTGTYYIWSGEGVELDDWRCLNDIPTGTLRGLHCVDAGPLYAVGDGGAVYYCSGTNLTLLRSEERVSLSGIQGCGSVDLLTVGSPGIILRRDNGIWIEDARFTDAAMYSIFGVGKQVFAAGEGGVLMHYDRETLDLDLSSASVDLLSLWGMRDDWMMAAGRTGKTLIFDGAAWNDLGLPAMDALYDIWGFSTADMWGVGAYGRIYHFDGSEWSLETDVSVEWLLGVWGPEPGDVFTVGRQGGIFRLVGGMWTIMHSGVELQLRDVWGTSGSDVFAVGEYGTILRYDGFVWSPMYAPTEEDLSGVWGFAPDDVIAVGENGTVLRYDGASWRVEECCTDVDLHSVWGSLDMDIFAAGSDGTIIHYGPTLE